MLFADIIDLSSQGYGTSLQSALQHLVGQRSAWPVGGAIRGRGGRLVSCITLSLNCSTGLVHCRAERDGGGGFTAGFFVGGAIFGVLGFLFAPQVRVDAAVSMPASSQISQTCSELYHSQVGRCGSLFLLALL